MGDPGPFLARVLAPSLSLTQPVALHNPQSIPRRRMDVCCVRSACAVRVQCVCSACAVLIGACSVRAQCVLSACPVRVQCVLSACAVRVQC